MSRLAVLIIKQTQGIKQKAVKIGENRIRVNKKAVFVMLCGYAICDKETVIGPVNKGLRRCLLAPGL